MATAPLFEAEDQTDEDFFNKLEDDDDFGVTGSEAAGIERALSNLSIGGSGESGSGSVAGDEDRPENGILQLVEDTKSDDLGVSDPFDFGEVAEHDVGPVESVAEAGSAPTEAVPVGSQQLDMDGAKGAGGVKVVQWSAFSVDSQQLDLGGFGLDSSPDFLMENSDTSVSALKAAVDPKSSFETPVSGLGTYISSSEQQDASLVYGAADAQATDVNDSQYWQDLYLGWKYDSHTGQWYQVDGYDATANTQSGNYDNVASVMVQETLQENVHEASNGFVSDQRSEESFFQRTAQSMVGTVTEDCVTNNVSNWNQVSQGSTEYPPHMVFDPQYPEWYYDTNTQQWHTLESYYAAIQRTSDTVQEHSIASNGSVAKENTGLNNGVVQYDQNSVLGHNNQYGGQGWSMGNYVQPKTWLPESVNQSTADTMYQYNQSQFESSQHSHNSNQNSDNFQQPFQNTSVPYSQFSNAHSEGRSSAGRPPHALVTFGFGGKLIVMKDASSFGTKFDYGSQDTMRESVSILSLVEVVMDKSDSSGIRTSTCDYFRALCQESFPGPLVGGNAATKDVYKWIDEKITNCQTPIMDPRKGELLRLLLSLLKISCQHYGKLRSPFASNPSLEEPDGPEAAVTKLFASARQNSACSREHDSFMQCMQGLPSEGQIRATAVEVQNLLVSGRRKEALQCAQAGQLWGPALVLAAQLGEKFYVDTVKQMAHRQLISGSPLRTLCLLIAGQPADVFSANSSNSNGIYSATSSPQLPAEIPANGMLHDWEENLAIIIANRIKDDELVIIHLGDCLLRERGEITAAHTCYLVAEANFESYSDSARLCLIGADHWNRPRTYASPEAIQRTELYEYSKVLGNSQFILLPFQPYKLVYAYMLAEVGRVTDSLRYCQASLKLLKNSARAPEVEMWKSSLSSLEERLRMHQQGGFNTNLAPGKIVGKIITSIDNSLQRIMGAPTPPLPPIPQSGVHGKENYLVKPKVSNSQSTLAISSLIPSQSVETINDWPGDNNRMSMHNRSISEPDFGRNPRQDQMKDASSPDAQSKTMLSGGQSRFGRIGSQLLQKTMGWVSVSRAGQAKLGEKNKFYYDEKLKRWVEEGVESPVEEPALQPPPTTASFQNGISNHNVESSFKTQDLSANGEPEMKSPPLSEYSSGNLNRSPSPNHFSARSAVGIRSRYVDTFNKGGGAAMKSFQSPSAPSVKPPSGAKFFVPATPAASDEQITNPAGEGIQDAGASGETSAPIANGGSFSSPPPAMHRFPSMDNIMDSSTKGRRSTPQNTGGSFSSRSRAASWSGSSGASPFMPANSSNLHPGTSPLQVRGGSFGGDDLHEVEL